MGGDCVQGEVTLFQDAFSHFDQTNSGMLNTRMLGPLLKFVGENPSDAEVQVNPLSNIKDNKLGLSCAKLRSRLVS